MACAKRSDRVLPRPSRSVRASTFAFAAKTAGIRSVHVTDQQEGILAVARGDVIGVAVDVFPGDRQVLEAGKDVPPDCGQLVRVVAADVEHRRLGLGREGVQPHREDGQLAGAARGLVQAARVGVEPGRGLGVHGADMGGIFPVRPPGLDRRGFRKLAPFHPGEDLLGVVAKRQAEVVDQRHRAVGADLGMQAKLGIGRAAADQRAARIVADPPQYRGADAGGPDHRMGLAPQRAQALLQLVQGRAGQADHLRTALDQMHRLQAQGADQHDLAVVIVAPGRRSACQPGIRRLEDHRAPRRDHRVQHPPLLHQRAGPDHRGHRAAAEAEAPGEAAGLAVGGQHMSGPDDAAQAGDQRIPCDRLGHLSPPCPVRAPVRPLPCRPRPAAQSGRAGQGSCRRCRGCRGGRTAPW